MRYLLDTNVLSEFKRSRPDPLAVDWIEAASEESLFISVLTLGELRQGAEQLPAGQRKRELDWWLKDELPSRFEGRVLEVTTEIAEVWGRLSAEVKRRGLSIGVVDRYLAATANFHTLTVVTRNTKDFQPLGVTLLNPWLLPES
jgi:predicted nucleic acid-binding protein